MLTDHTLALKNAQKEHLKLTAPDEDQLMRIITMSWKQPSLKWSISLSDRRKLHSIGSLNHHLSSQLTYRQN